MVAVCNETRTKVQGFGFSVCLTFNAKGESKGKDMENKMEAGSIQGFMGILLSNYPYLGVCLYVCSTLYHVCRRNLEP